MQDSIQWMLCAARGKCPVPHAEDVPHWHALSRGYWVPLDASIARDDPDAATAAALGVALEVEAGGWTDGAPETLTAYATRWLDAREGRVNSIRDDRSRLRDHVLPLVGHLEAAGFTRNDVEDVRDALDAKIASGALNWKTAHNAWATFSKLCDDAANAKRRELRVRADNCVFRADPGAHSDGTRGLIPR